MPIFCLIDYFMVEIIGIRHWNNNLHEIWNEMMQDRFWMQAHPIGCGRIRVDAGASEWMQAHPMFTETSGWIRAASIGCGSHPSWTDRSGSGDVQIVPVIGMRVASVGCGSHWVTERLRMYAVDWMQAASVGYRPHPLDAGRIRTDLCSNCSFFWSLFKGIGFQTPRVMKNPSFACQDLPHLILHSCVEINGVFGIYSIDCCRDECLAYHGRHPQGVCRFEVNPGLPCTCSCSDQQSGGRKRGAMHESSHPCL